MEPSSKSRLARTRIGIDRRNTGKSWDALEMKAVLILTGIVQCVITSVMLARLNDILAALRDIMP